MRSPCPSAEAIREAAPRLNVPTDVIIEVGAGQPEMFVSGAKKARKSVSGYDILLSPLCPRGEACSLLFPNPSAVSRQY
jgi:hypothetical protein